MLGTNIKELRMQRGITQTDLADSLGRTQQAVAGWENGRFNPDVPTLQKLAQYFRVSADYLLGNDSPPTHSPAESSLVEQYRRLSPDNKLMVERMISALAAQQQSA